MLFRSLLPIPAAASLLISSVLALWLTGCATLTPPAPPRPFSFQDDAFAFNNELAWEYHFDAASGQLQTERRSPKPSYTLRCFVLARSVRQFFYHAQFAPHLPKTNSATYRKLIRHIANRPVRALPARQIIIPGYANLRDFSLAHEHTLKKELGGAWQSYVQRGHWRMLFPFSRRHQEHTAQRLAAAIDSHHLPILHVVRFPQLTINHAIVVFDYSETDRTIEFMAYDPNDNQQAITLTYHRSTRSFYLPPNKYFAGGRVDAYDVYRNFCF